MWKINRKWPVWGYPKEARTSTAFISGQSIIPVAFYTTWIFIWHSNLHLRLVSSPTENLVVGEDADHRRQGSHDAKYLSKRYYNF